jgi:hypothetical protein
MADLTEHEKRYIADKEREIYERTGAFGGDTFETPEQVRKFFADWNGYYSGEFGYEIDQEDLGEYAELVIKYRIHCDFDDAVECRSCGKTISDRYAIETDSGPQCDECAFLCANCHRRVDVNDGQKRHVLGSGSHLDEGASVCAACYKEITGQFPEAKEK